MPVDIHPKEKISGVEIILTAACTRAENSTNKTYQHAGGCTAWGVSVVNALSKNLEIWVRRGGKEYNKATPRQNPLPSSRFVGDVAKSKTGTTIRFWPDPKYFDTDKFAIPETQAGAARQGGAVSEFAGDAQQRKHG